jgi:polar amino acid transport system substrate-binding protein
MLQAEFDSIVPAVGYKYNLGISAFTITDERKEVVDFIPAFHVGEAFAVQAGNPSNVSDPSEDEFALCGMRVGVQIGTVEELELDDSSEKCVEAGQEPIESWRWPMDMQAATALNGGRIDILYTDLPIVNYLEKQTQGDIIGWGKPVNFAYHGIAINKNDVELREAVRAALIYLMDNGIYSDIMKYWGQSNIAFEDESQVDTQQEFYENKSEEQILREKSIEIDSEFVANN